MSASEMWINVVNLQLRLDAIQLAYDKCDAELERVRAHDQRLADALSISTTTLETVFADDPKNISAKCCIERNRKAIAQWEGIK